MKHLALDFHFVREKVAAAEIKVLHLSTIDQLADLLTKPLPRLRFLTLRDKLRSVQDSPCLRGRVEAVKCQHPETVVAPTTLNLSNRFQLR